MGKIEVEDHIDRRYVQASSGDVRSNEYISASRAELAQCTQPGRLGELAVERNRAESKSPEQYSYSLGLIDRAGEDDDGF